jgi:hypothetical protein
MTTINIDHQRFNQIRDKVVQVMGQGFGNFGYGQTNLVSQRAIQSTLIRAEDFNRLRTDILRMRQHQTGQDRSNLPSTDPEFLKVLLGSEITNIEDRDYIENLHFTKLDTAATAGINNRFAIGGDPSGNQEFTLETYINTPNGPGTSGGVITQRTDPWRSTLTHTFRVQFRNGNEARYFFNAGGQILITPNFSPSVSNAKNLAWERLLNTLVGSVRFGYNYTNNTGTGGGGTQFGFYNLTTVPRTIYQKSSDPTYGENLYKIQAFVNSTNNDPDSTGYNSNVATQITFTVEFLDLHEETVTQTTDPATGVPYAIVNPDEDVVGTLISEVGQRRPTGPNVSVFGPSSYTNLALIS